jgi:hypothetical protein
MDDQQLRAIIGARLNGCSWPDITQAVSVTTETSAPMGPVIARYGAAGLSWLQTRRPAPTTSQIELAHT